MRDKTKRLKIKKRVLLNRSLVPIVFLAAVASGVSYPAAEDAVLAVKGGTIQTIAQGTIEGGVILIRNGKIEAVGKGMPIPKEARILDAGRGAVILPGFIDAFTNLGADEGAFGADFDEASSPVTPHLRIIDAVNPQSGFIPAARRAGVTAALTAPGAGNLISGQSALLRLAGSNVEEMIVRFPVAVHASLGEAPKLRYGLKNQAPQTRMGEAALLREWFVETRQYQDSIEAAAAKQREFEKKGGNGDKPAMPAANLKCEALVPVLQGRLPLIVRADRMDDILTALRIAEEFNLRIILCGGAEAYKLADRLAVKKIPVIVRPDAAARLSVETQGALGENAALLQKAGIKIAFQSGSIRNTTGLVEQARRSVTFGLKPAEALKALTINAAEMFGASAELGSIEKGKSADLVIYNADPLSTLARVKTVIICGKIVDRD